MHSAIYEGSLGHRRIAERPHEFSYRVAMPYLDLDEIGDLVGGRLTLARPGLARFRRQDYLGDPAVRADRLGSRPDPRSPRHHAPGPVRLLTHLRSFGRCFNPVSFYYCFAADGEGLEAIVAEVTNTPWGERCAYVLPCGDNADGGPLIGGTFDKMLHVSPFMGMEQRYAWLASVPGETLSIHIDSIRGRGAAPSRPTSCSTADRSTAAPWR